MTAPRQLTPDDVRALARTASLDEAAGAARDALPPATLSALAPADALAWSRVAQEVGELDLALAALTRARDAAAEAPAPLRAEIDAEWDALQQDLGLSGPPPGTSPPPGAPPSPPPSGEAGVPGRSPGGPPPVLRRDPYLEPTDAQLVRFTHLFGGREDTHARQWADLRGRKAGYSPVSGPVTPALARAHLAGSLTLGAYLLRVDGTVTFFVLDLDVRKRALEDTAHHPSQRQELLERAAHAGLTLRSQAAALGLPLLLEDSGFKGRHLWGLLAEPLPAELVFRLGRALLGALAPADPALHLEAFPKQAHVRPGGLGNLVKLPLGVHRRSGRRALLLDDEGNRLEDPWRVLLSPPRVSREAVMDALATLRDRAASAPPRPSAPAPEAASHGAAGPSSAPPAAPADDPALRAVIRGCAVVRTLLTRGLVTRRLTHDQRVVLRHSLGHLPAGVRLVNDLFERCPEVPAEDRLGRVLRGHPISCARIRQRVPELTSALPCHCDLAPDASTYPTPVTYARAPLPRLALPAAAPTIDVEPLPPSEPSPPTPSPPPEAPSPPPEPPTPAWDGLAAALAVLPGQLLPMPGGAWTLDARGEPRWTPGASPPVGAPALRPAPRPERPPARQPTRQPTH